MHLTFIFFSEIYPVTSLHATTMLCVQHIRSGAATTVILLLYYSILFL